MEVPIIKNAFKNFFRIFNNPEMLKLPAVVSGIENKISILEEKIKIIDDDFVTQNKNLSDLSKLCRTMTEREIETIKMLCMEILNERKKTIKPKLITDYPVAFDSPDHIEPRGTKNDNTKYYHFNHKLYQYLNRADIKLLDIGCSGGGFVQSIIEDGHFAVGLEGSDYSKKISRAAWRIIPGNLFTCDVVKPFTVADSEGHRITFDVITAWELMEHISERDLPLLIQNLKQHLTDDGIFICSIALFEDFDAETGIHWHQTVKPKEWWLELFDREELSEVHHDFFSKDDWLRGGGHGEMDWHEDDGLGFHIILKKK